MPYALKAPSQLRPVFWVSRAPLIQYSNTPLDCPASLSLTCASIQYHWPTWLASKSGVLPYAVPSHVGQWYCIEAHVKLNDAGQSNGVFEYWINGALETQKTGLNWLGAFSAYGINTVMFENYNNYGSPVAQDRYIDKIVVSTQRVGC